MMNFEAFSSVIKSELGRRFPHSDVEFSVVDKLNVSYNAVTIRDTNPTEGISASPCINLDQMFQAYCSGLGISDILSLVLQVAERERPRFSFDITDPELIPDRLIMRVHGAEPCGHMLSSIPHRIVDDLVITYHVFATDPDGSGFYSTLVDYKMLGHLSLTEDELHEAACRSSMKNFPARLIPMYEVVCDSIMKSFTESRDRIPEGDIVDMLLSLNNRLYVLTNSDMICGASTMFYPGQLSVIASLLGAKTLVILPSSRNEVILAPDATEEIRDFRNIVESINLSEVAAEEKLTDSVYCYYSETDEFMKVG